jgi:hypothetical protein
MLVLVASAIFIVCNTAACAGSSETSADGVEELLGHT